MISDYNTTEGNNKDFLTRIFQIMSSVQQIMKENNNQMRYIPANQKVKYFNLWADYWRYVIGVNVIPADTKNKKTSIKWLQYQNSPISEEQHNKWKQEGAFVNGMAIIAGRVWHNHKKKGLYLVLVDLDNQKAIDEFCTRNGVMTPLGELAKTLMVEQHDDEPHKAHIMFYASHPFRKKSTDTITKTMSDKLVKNEIPAIEIKGAGEHGVLFVTPSIHKYGKNYHIIGTIELGTTPFDGLEIHLDNICNKYGIPYLTNGNGNVTKQPIDELFNEDTKIYEGHNRHEAILRVMESLLRRNLKILTHEQIKLLAIEWNQKHCIPPIDNKEFERQWNDAIKFIERTSVQDKQREKYPELAGNVYYRINEKPEKYIIAYRQNHKTIEVTATRVEKKSGDNVTIERYLKHYRTYLACIPVRIVRHMNPLAFLETPTGYSITFVDSVGETNSLNHKTLAEIVQSLRDLGYVLSDGADMALAAMVQAYKENKLIEDNEDIEYIGFFTDKDNKIIASNIDIVEPDPQKLLDAIIFLVDELKQHFENRLDLLATSVVWGMVAPLIFMLKTNNYFLKALDYYGFANATKSNTGKIVLALDGHQEDARYAMQFSRIDTPARLGQAVSRSTFPILVDEVNLSDSEMKNI